MCRACRCPRSFWRQHVHRVQKLQKEASKQIYYITYVGDKPGEGTNIGCGLVNCVEEVERAD